MRIGSQIETLRRGAGLEPIKGDKGVGQTLSPASRGCCRGAEGTVPTPQNGGLKSPWEKLSTYSRQLSDFILNMGSGNGHTPCRGPFQCWKCPGSPLYASAVTHLLMRLQTSAPWTILSEWQIYGDLMQTYGLIRSLLINVCYPLTLEDNQAEKRHEISSRNGEPWYA